MNCVLHGRKTDWNLFREIINSSLNIKVVLKSEEHIIAAVEHFNSTVQNAAWESSPPRINKDSKLIYPSTILDKVAENRNLRRLWQQTGCPRTKTILNYTIKELKKLLHDERNKGIQTFLQQLDTSAASDYSLWKATKN